MKKANPHAMPDVLVLLLDRAFREGGGIPCHAPIRNPAGVGARERRELDRERAKSLRLSAKRAVRSLAAAIKQTKIDRARQIVEARERCKRERLAVAGNVKEARASLKRQAVELKEHGAAARLAAREACAVSRAAARDLSPIERARALLNAERVYQKEMALLERHARERVRGVSRSRFVKGARASQSDEEVRGNIPPELVPLFDRVKGKIRASDRASRTETFLKYAEEHPHEIANAIEAISERHIAQMERAHREASRLARKRTYTAAELADVPF